MRSGSWRARGGGRDTAAGGGVVAPRRRVESLPYGHGAAPGQRVGGDWRSGSGGSVCPAACRSASDRARSSPGPQPGENDRAAAGLLYARLTSLQTRGPRFCADGPRLRNVTSWSCVTSTNAVSHTEPLNPYFIAGRHRQRQQHVSVSVCDEERQLSPSTCGDLLQSEARYFPLVLVDTGAAEGECLPAEGPADIDLGRTGNLKRERLRCRRWRRWLNGFERGLAADQQHGASDAGVERGEGKATHRPSLGEGTGFV